MKTFAVNGTLTLTVSVTLQIQAHNKKHATERFQELTDGGVIGAWDPLEAIPSDVEFNDEAQEVTVEMVEEVDV